MYRGDIVKTLPVKAKERFIDVRQRRRSSPCLPALDFLAELLIVLKEAMWPFNRFFDQRGPNKNLGGFARIDFAVRNEARKDLQSAQNYFFAREHPALVCAPVR